MVESRCAHSFDSRRGWQIPLAQFFFLCLYSSEVFDCFQWWYIENYQDPISQFSSQLRQAISRRVRRHLVWLCWSQIRNPHIQWSGINQLQIVFMKKRVLLSLESYASVVFGAGVLGKWILRLMKGFLKTGSGSSELEDLSKKGKGAKGRRCYVPQKNYVPYALLITLYRGTENGIEFMRKQELIDAAEASGLSRVPIMPEIGKGKPGHFSTSAKDWYSGWSCMTTLINKGLVVKPSCPEKWVIQD